jgi:hypothetical protein
MAEAQNNPSTAEAIVEASAPPESKEKPKGFKRAALLISRRTTDFIAIAIVAFGLFAVSGRLSDWWSTPADSPINSQQTALQVAGDQLAWNDNHSPVIMQLGTLPVELQRATIKGDQKALEEFVVPRLAKLVDSTPASDWPISVSDVKQDVTSQRMVEAERKLLSGIQSIQPMQKTKSGVIYRIDEPGSIGFNSTFVGVRKSVGDDLRVVAWSMAIPYRSNDWRIFLFRRHGKKNHEHGSFPLPSDAQRIFSIGDVDGDGLMSFARKGPKSKKAQVKTDWQDFFSNRFSSGGWQPTRKWTQSGQLSSARFENSELAVVVEITINNKNDSGVVNVMTSTN